jgi:hypothetical protein
MLKEAADGRPADKLTNRLKLQDSSLKQKRVVEAL